MIEQKYFDRLCIINDEYKDMGIEKVSGLVDKGRLLIERHGEEDLPFKLQTEEDFLAAGAFFDYRLTTDESNYEAE